MKPARIAWAAIAAAAILGAGYLARQKLSSSHTPVFMTATVSRGDIEETVLATGTLKPVRLVAVGAQASGRITAIKVKLGQVVRAGDLIAEIDSVTQQNNLRTAEAALANVKAQLAEKQATLVLNRQTLARQTSMVAQKAVSQADFENADAAVNVTLAQIEALQAQIVEGQVAVETAKANLGYTQIIAPIDGTVLAIVSQEGQTVNAVQTAPTIVVLGDLTKMTVRTEISEADITKVRAGLPLYFTVLGEPDQRYEARLESIEPAPESIRNDSSFSSSATSATSSSGTSGGTSSSSAIYYMGVFSVPNKDGHLRTYMTAEVHIVLGQAKNALLIPSAALEAPDVDGRHAVRVVGHDGKTTIRQVEIGLNNKVMAEVRSGLDESERVVTEEAASAASSSALPSPPPLSP